MNVIRNSVVKLPCQHTYDIDCIERLLTCSIFQSSTLPSCCDCGITIELDYVASFLEKGILAGFQEALQLATQEPGGDSGDDVTNPRSSPLSPEKEFMEREKEAVLDMGRRLGWCRCPDCGTVIEKQYGCDHMTCFCGKDFSHNAELVKGGQYDILPTPLPLVAHDRVTKKPRNVFTILKQIFSRN